MSTRLSADAASRVVAMVSESLSAEQDPKTWNEIVELTADTSIRRNVKPVGIPSDDASRAVAVHNAGAIPELAKLARYEGSAAAPTDENRPTPGYAPRIVSSRAFHPIDS